MVGIISIVPVAAIKLKRKLNVVTYFLLFLGNKVIKYVFDCCKHLSMQKKSNKKMRYMGMVSKK